LILNAKAWSTFQLKMLTTCCDRFSNVKRSKEAWPLAFINFWHHWAMSCAPDQSPPGSGGPPGGSGGSSSGGSTTMRVSLSYMPSLKWTYPSSPDNVQDGQSPDPESAKGAIDSSLMNSVSSALDQMGISPSQLSVTSDIVPIEGPAKPGCFIAAKGIAVAVAGDCYDPATFKPLTEAAFVNIKLANTLTSKQRHDFAFFWFGILVQEGVFIVDPIQIN
uniref:Cellulase n=1 Tax=Toxocara canis TaxID=6265 RepID=A0A183U3H0_TOXCA